MSSLMAWNWRGLAELGFSPATSFLIWASISSSSSEPESPSWPPASGVSMLWCTGHMSAAQLKSPEDCLEAQHLPGQSFSHRAALTWEKRSSTSEIHFPSFPISQVTKTPQSPLSMPALPFWCLCQLPPPCNTHIRSPDYWGNTMERRRKTFGWSLGRARRESEQK